MAARKEIEWIGPARRELRDFPLLARRQAGADLNLVQDGLEPGDWKPMEGIGPGAREIRVRTFDGGTLQHRVIYVAKFSEAVYVLHAFEKKTAQTPPHHIEVAAVRYRQMLAKRALLDRSKGGLR
jgi:phage-related protein